DLRVRLPLPIESHSVNLRGEASVFPAIKRGLDLSRRNAGAHQISQTSAAVVQIFGREKIEEISPDHLFGLVRLYAEHSKHGLVGHTNRAVDAGDDHAIGREFDEQPVSFLALA